MAGVDQALVDAAIALIHQRFEITEMAGAAAMYTSHGDLLSSTYKYTENGNAIVCYETGAICDAHKFGHTITASACVVRMPSSDRFLIVAPCGICQERLFRWGPEVEIAMPSPDDPSRWIAKKLGDIQPYYWASALIRPAR
jgi:cytidine deaminase